jgi:hypothetical protein
MALGLPVKLGFWVFGEAIVAAVVACYQRYSMLQWLLR